MKKRPHIIIFNPDEMRSDALHHLGNPAAITPNLDAFAQKDAVSFRNAYCQNPVCVPSRCSFFTGLYPHVHGHRTMGYLLHPEEPSLFQELKEAGYHVWMNDRNDLVAGQLDGLAQHHATTIYYGNQKAHPPKFAQKNRRGDIKSPWYYSHMDGKILNDASGTYYSSDDEVVDAAISYMRNHHDQPDHPLCMFLGLMSPHVPYQIEEPFYSAIDRRKLPKRIHGDACQGKADILDKIRGYTGLQGLSEADWDEIRAVYLGMCMKVDRQFGRMIQALKEEGIYDDCAIFFLSDHGDFTGDYDLVEKTQNTFEDCLTKVPLLIKPPSDFPLDPGISDALVELVDFYATAMDFARVTPSHTHFGHTLSPILTNREKKIRSYVFSEGGRQPGERHCDEYHSCGEKGTPSTSPYWPKMMAQTDDKAHAKGIMIRDDQYKYISRTNGQDEFYDLKQDPGETVNLINVPAYDKKISQMQLEMLKWLESTCDIVPFSQDQRFTPEMLWARVCRMVPPGREAEIKEMIQNGENFVVIMQQCQNINAKEK